MAVHALTPARGGRTRGRARGQSLVEFLIVVPVFLFLVLGIVQAVLLFRAKSTLDYAALEAARAGATAGAGMAQIRRGLQRGLTPLFANDPTPEGLSSAFTRAGADVADHACVEIVNPTHAAWLQHRERDHRGDEVLPNDSLAFRDARVDPNTGPGRPSSGVSVQDANLLKVRVVYRHPLVVPFVDRVLRGASTLVRGGADTAMSRGGGERFFRLPLESHAIVRMQSPIGRAAATQLLSCPDCPRRCDGW